MRPTPLCLLTLAVASADPPLEPAFEIAFDGARIEGRFVEADRAVTFDAEAIAGRDAAAVSLDLRRQLDPGHRRAPRPALLPVRLGGRHHAAHHHRPSSSPVAVEVAENDAPLEAVMFGFPGSW